MKLVPAIEKFFDQYLIRIKGVSQNTIKSYRDTFTSFLPFAAQFYHVKIDSLKGDHLSHRLIFEFLNHLEDHLGNSANTRNQRLAALKSFAKMLRLIYPEEIEIAQMILNIPQKRTQRTLISFLNLDEILKLYGAVDMKKKEGMRDYTILYLLFDSGARASEIATLNIDSYNFQNNNLAILGKGNRLRIIELSNKTGQLIKLYIKEYRKHAKPLYQNRLFINQRKEEFTRHGIYRICRKYLNQAFDKRRLQEINPVHSLRHSCAVYMLTNGHSITDIKNRLGHEDLQSTMIYLKLDLSAKKDVQKRFLQYTKAIIKDDQKIDDLIRWENKKDTLNWLDKL